MDNQKLNNWILDHAHTLDIKIERMEWIKEWFPEYYDFNVKACFEGNIIEGRGIDKDQDSALLKAFSELIERIACKHLGIRSNGVAAHFNKNMARENAKKELIERDAILSHFLTSEPFFLKEVFPWMNEFEKRLLSIGLEVSFGEAYSSVSDCHVVACKVLGREKFGAFWGYGNDYDLSKAYHHAALECMVNVSAYLYGAYRPQRIDLESFNRLSIVNGVDHQRLHYTQDLLKLEVGQPSIDDKEVLNLEEIEVENIELTSIGDFSSVPLFVCRATSKRLQNIFYREPHTDVINLNRLEQFSGRKLTFDDVLLTPHPIG